MSSISNGRIKVSKDNLRGLVLILFTGLISVFIIILTNNVLLHVISMWAIAVVAILIARFDFLHPYSWYSLFFTLYSTSNAILWNAGLRDGGYNRWQILYPVFALIIVLLIVEPIKVEKADSIEPNRIIQGNVLKLVIFILTVLLLLFSIILHYRGYSSKEEMKAAGDLFFRFGNLFARYLTIFVLLYIGKMMSNNNHNSWKLIIFCGLSTLLFTLFTSERDVFFRFCYTILILLIAYSFIKPKHLIIVFPCAILGMVISVIIKSYFLRSNINIGTGNILYDFLSSDFSAAGGNLQYLLENSWTKGALGIRTYFTELLNPFIIGFSIPSPDHWFNYEVHTGLYKGFAFTLVGTGYAIDGLFGVFLIFITVGLLIRLFYRNSNNSLVWLVSYIYLSSTIIFSFRQSLQTITNSMVVHIGIAILFCILVDRFRISIWRKE